MPAEIDFWAIRIGSSPSYLGMDFAKGAVGAALPKRLSGGTETTHGFRGRWEGEGADSIVYSDNNPMAESLLLRE
jgi:hypothetical protein